MNNNESPLSIAEQIEVLEEAKKAFVELSDCYNSIGLCWAINCVIYKYYSHLAEISLHKGIHNVIPSFTFENAVLSGTVSDYASLS